MLQNVGRIFFTEKVSLVLSNYIRQ